MDILSLAFIFLTYLIGSISFGFLIGKFVRGIDIREVGSGSTGATNVTRTCGLYWGIIALILDIGKAAIPLFIAIQLEMPIWTHPIIGLSSILGHIWPIFNNFKGGKGIASGWAALMVLSPICGILCLIISVPIIAITRFVSLGSIIGSIIGGIILTIMSIYEYNPISLINPLEPIYSIFGIIGASITIILHRKNITRLLNGQERKFGERA